jgi:hypothetical protein
MAENLLTVVVVTALAAAGLLLYVSPVLVGWARHVPDMGSLAVINLLLGWTLIGWVLALAMALRSVPPPPVQFVQNLPPAPPWQQPLPGRWSGPAAPGQRQDAPPLILAPRPPDASSQADTPSRPGAQDGLDPWNPAERG